MFSRALGHCIVCKCALAVVSSITVHPSSDHSTTHAVKLLSNTAVQRDGWVGTTCPGGDGFGGYYLSCNAQKAEDLSSLFYTSTFSFAPLSSPHSLVLAAGTSSVSPPGDTFSVPMCGAGAGSWHVGTWAHLVDAGTSDTSRTNMMWELNAIYPFPQTPLAVLAVCPSL